jgi:hypothetical protein
MASRAAGAYTSDMDAFKKTDRAPAPGFPHRAKKRRGGPIAGHCGTGRRRFVACAAALCLLPLGLAPGCAAPRPPSGDIGGYVNPKPIDDPWFKPVWGSAAETAIRETGWANLPDVPFAALHWQPDDPLMARLEQSPWLELTPADIAHLKALNSGGLALDVPLLDSARPAGKRYFLARAFTYGQVNSVVRIGRDILVSSHIMTHGLPPWVRMAIILELDAPPDQVWMEVGAAA